MKFYGRLAPGIVTDLREPLEVVVHQPRQAAAGVAVKIWERASYTDIDGRFVEEGGQDELLLELRGSVAPDPELRRRGRARFAVDRVVMPPRDGKTALGVLRVRVECETTIHEVPIPSTEAELGGQNFEIGLSIEHGGAEVFRSGVTTFIRPALANPRVAARRLVGFDDSGEPIHDDDDEPMLAGRYATIGLSSSPNDDGHLVVLGLAVIGVDGRLAPCTEDGEPREGELLLLRTHRDLFAHVTTQVPKASKTVGASTIAIRLCHEIEVDGTLRVDVPDTSRVYQFDIIEGDASE